MSGRSFLAGIGVGALAVALALMPFILQPSVFPVPEPSNVRTPSLSRGEPSNALPSARRALLSDVARDWGFLGRLVCRTEER